MTEGGGLVDTERYLDDRGFRLCLYVVVLVGATFSKEVVEASA